MKIFLFALTVFLVTPCIAIAQINLDSLLSLLDSPKEDTSTVLLLINIADAYETNQQDSAWHYLEKARNLAEKLGYKRGLYKYYEHSLIVAFTVGDNNLASVHGSKALELAAQLQDTSYMINILNNTGIINQYLGKFDEQLDLTLQALKLLEARKNYDKLSSVYHNIGNAYFNLMQHQKCIEYCRLSLDTNQKYGGNQYLNRVYISLADSYSELNKADSALYFYEVALHESLKVNDKYALAGIYAHMMPLYARMYDFPGMLEISAESRKLAEEMQSKQMLAVAYYITAYAEFLNRNQEQAKDYIQKALKIAEKDTLLDELKNSQDLLSYIAAVNGDMKGSVRAKSIADSLRNAQVSEDVLRKTTEMAEKYETEKKEAQIRLQEIQIHHQSITNIFLVSGFFLLAVTSSLIYLYLTNRQKYQSQRIEKLETEKQLLATEAVLRGEEQERVRLAKDLHDGLGGMLSGIKFSFNSIKKNLVMTALDMQSFDRNIDLLDSSIQELRRVSHNMMPESLIKFGLNAALRDFCIDIKKSGALQVVYQSVGMEHATIDQPTAISIYRIVQELVNNVMKHAAATTALVQVTKSDNYYTIAVEDNGAGFNTANLDKAKGIGWNNIQQRVNLLKGQLKLTSEPGKGTAVQIEFST